jgi:hypothetical protein
MSGLVVLPLAEWMRSGNSNEFASSCPEAFSLVSR